VQVAFMFKTKEAGGACAVQRQPARATMVNIKVHDELSVIWRITEGTQ
jgi:hypothetical protein